MSDKNLLPRRNENEINFTKEHLLVLGIAAEKLDELIDWIINNLEFTNSLEFKFKIGLKQINQLKEMKTTKGGTKNGKEQKKLTEF